MDGETERKRKKETLDQVVDKGLRARGKRDLMFFLSGASITRGQAIAAKCYDCMGYFQDKEIRRDRDCGCATCPLYPYNPNAHFKPQWREDELRMYIQRYRDRLRARAESD